MTAIIELDELIRNMTPELQEAEYVFCSLPSARYGDYSELAPLASYAEPEGLTLVLKRQTADQAKLPYEGHFRAISLKVHSSLEAVGLTAAVADTLTRHNISANVIAAYYHDYIFVPAAKAQEAMTALLEMSHQ